MSAGQKSYDVVRIEVELRNLTAVVTVQESFEDEDGEVNPVRKDSRQVALADLFPASELEAKRKRAHELYVGVVAQERKLAAAERAASAAAKEAARAAAELGSLNGAGTGGK